MVLGVCVKKVCYNEAYEKGSGQGATCRVKREETVREKGQTLIPLMPRAVALNEEEGEKNAGRMAVSQGNLGGGGCPCYDGDSFRDLAYSSS